MGRFLKRRLGLIIVIIIVLVFPISLSNQARLNTRVIITGLAIDKVDNKYEVTAQIVKTSPGVESGGTSAMVNFVSDSDETLVGALAKLTYKAGKVSAFSHTNFVILGSDLQEDNLTESLDYFVRNKTIKSSALLLFADEKASDELKKTKDIELSVGIGLQKVFLFKEIEGDGEMMTILNFLKDSKSYSRTSTASTLKLMSNNETSKQSSSSSGDNSSIGESSSGSSESGSQSGGTSSGESSESSSGGSGSNYQYFEALSPIVCVVDGKYVGKLEKKEEIMGYMIARDKASSEDISLSNVKGGRLDNAKIGIKVNHKHTKSIIRFENGVPCLDIKIKMNNCEIEDFQNKMLISELTTEEYNLIKKEIENDTRKKVAACFDKSKSFGADVFHAYDTAMKYHFKSTTKLYNSMPKFLENLKLNVEVDVVRLDY